MTRMEMTARLRDAAENRRSKERTQFDWMGACVMTATILAVGIFGGIVFGEFLIWLIN